MVFFYDTTLRDGSQQKDIHLNCNQKIQALEEIDKLNLDYIEIGWPGVNCHTDKFLKYLNQGTKLDNLVLFGSTRKAKNTVEQEPLLYDRINADAFIMCDTNGYRYEDQ